MPAPPATQMRIGYWDKSAVGLYDDSMRTGIVVCWDRRCVIPESRRTRKVRERVPDHGGVAAAVEVKLEQLEIEVKSSPVQRDSDEPVKKVKAKRMQVRLLLLLGNFTSFSTTICK